jgi:hypothetical protein
MNIGKLDKTELIRTNHSLVESNLPFQLLSFSENLSSTTLQTLFESVGTHWTSQISERKLPFFITKKFHILRSHILCFPKAE